MPNTKILVVDDHPANVKAIRVKMEAEGYDIISASNGVEAVKYFETSAPDLVLLDIMMPGMDGYETCRRIKEISSDTFTPIILVTAKTETEALVAGFDAGADDFITKPFKPIELAARVRGMLRIRAMQRENRHLKAELTKHRRSGVIVGEAPAMRRVFELVDRVKDGDVTVLLSGETGTGKEAFAQMLHAEGPRREQRFIALNCGALTETLLESELFGHGKGAFTGATENKIGLLEAANGGTVLLDEVSETSPSFQAKLLRVLQEKEITRVGELEPRKIDVRIIAATNRDLEQEIREGRFREDLYYRLSVFPIELPALRERREDIPILTRHLMERYANTLGREVPDLTEQALGALTVYEWPGNVRELANEIQRALVLSPSGEAIDLDVLSDKISFRMDGDLTTRPGTLRHGVAEVERELIGRALATCDGNKTQMAEQLGISRWTLLQKMRAHRFES